MPGGKRTHEQNRALVCLLCFNKAKELRRINDNTACLIQKHVIENFNDEDARLPSSLCGTCRSWLSKTEKGMASNEASTLPIFDHSPLLVQERLMETRSTSNRDCSCTVCQIATSNGRRSSELSGEKRARGRPSVNASEMKSTCKPMKLCMKCLCVVGRGKPHPCSLTSKLDNLTDFVKTDKEKDQLMSKCIDQKLSLSSSKSNVEMSLARDAGKPMKIIVSPKAAKSGDQLTAEHASRVQVAMNLSVRGRNKLTHAIRDIMGATSVEPHIRDSLFEMDHRLDEFFSLKILRFTRMENGKVIDHEEKPGVACQDINGLVDYIIHERDLKCELKYWIKIGLDGGGNFLKVTLSIFCECPQQKSKSAFLDSGVKKCIIIAIAPAIQENYFNVKALWLGAGIQNLHRRFHVASDLKMCNIALGIMSHSCLHPCSWCSTNKHSLDVRGESRTVGSLNKSFWSYFDSGSMKEQAKHHSNVVHPSLIKGPADSLIIAHVPPPELHILIGAVCTLFKEMKTRWSDADLWLKACSIELQHFHGGTLNGNDSRKLLRNVDKLRAICPLHCLEYVATFSALNEVVESCFGNELRDDFQVCCDRFHAMYKRLEITITPKVHAIFFHVPEFCLMMNSSLGRYSEQTPESVHYEFQQHWLKFKVSESNPSFADKLFRSVCMYNSRHL